LYIKNKIKIKHTISFIDPVTYLFIGPIPEPSLLNINGWTFFIWLRRFVVDASEKFAL
jgi:hypothetical protein